MNDHSFTHRLFIIASYVGILGWMGLILLLGFWYLVPVKLPTVEEPIPILNEYHKVAVGEPILLELNVVKTVDLEAVAATRFISCVSGNLITLTAAPTSLPVGTYTIVSDSILLPNKVNVGDQCTMNYRITYYINPVRNEVQLFASEPFSVSESEEVQ